MARDMSADMSAELSAKLLRPLIFVELQFRSATTRNFNGLGTVHWNGQDWLGFGEFLAITESEENTDGTASRAVLSLSGIDPAYVALAYSDEYRNRPARVWIGAVDAAGAIVADPVPFIFGLMDSIADNDDPEATTYSLTIKTQAADQRFRRAWRLTDAHQQQLFPGDKGLEFVAGLASKKLVWGPSS